MPGQASVANLRKRSASNLFRRIRARALTLVETAIVVLAISGGLFLLVGWMTGVRADARRDLTVRLLADLDKALARYHRATGQYPNSPGGPNAAHWAVAALLDNERTHAILEALPPIVWRGSARGDLIDAWGMPIRYLSDANDSPFVKANNGQPVFMSAGPDRIFGDGDEDPDGLADNLRSDDPGPDGFRLHDVLRETVTEEEANNGQKDD